MQNEVSVSAAPTNQEGENITEPIQPIMASSSGPSHQIDNSVDSVDHCNRPGPSFHSRPYSPYQNRALVRGHLKPHRQPQIGRRPFTPSPSPPVHRKKKKHYNNTLCDNTANLSQYGIPPTFFYNYTTESVTENLFNKKRELVCGNPRPPTHCICIDSEDCNWSIPELISLKTRLNTVKSRLDNFVLDTWHKHTKLMNPAGHVMRHIRGAFHPEYCSQAWCKFYECLGKFPIIPDRIKEVCKPTTEPRSDENVNLGVHREEFTSVHLCEAPGAFISALNHYINTTLPTLKWDWLATSLSPYWEGNSVNEMINDDVLMQSSIENWSFLADGTGNLISQSNIKDFIQSVRKKFGEVDLVTADGSIDCQLNPCEQEQMVVQLHFAEIVTALSVLKQGGCFVLKIFTFLEAPTISQLYLLSHVFRQMYLFKPATSKEGNSEVYVICLQFIGVNPELLSHLLSNMDNPTVQAGIQGLFKKHFLAQEFLTNLIECAEFFAENQIHVIWKNIQSFQNTTLYYSLMYEIKRTVVNVWMESYNVHALPKAFELFKGFKTNWINYVDLREKKFLTHAQEIQRENFSGQTPRAIMDQIMKKLVPFKNYLQRQIENDAEENGCETWRVIKQNMVTDITTYEETGVKLVGYYRLLPGNFGFSKPFVNINCSRFCSAKLLEQRCKIRQIFANCGMEAPGRKQCSCCTDRKGLHERLKSLLGNPHTEVPDLVILEGSESNDNTPIVLVHCFHESLGALLGRSDIELTLIQLQPFLNLLLSRLELTDSFFLCSYPLLTRLHIGILFCLIMAFENVYLSSNGVFLHRFNGFTITDDVAVEAAKTDSTGSLDLHMEFRPHWEKLRRHLSVLPSCLVSNPKNVEVLLECLPIHRLYKSSYCNVIYTYNISQVVGSVQEYIAECQEMLKKKSQPQKTTEDMKPSCPLALAAEVHNKLAERLFRSDSSPPEPQRHLKRRN